MATVARSPKIHGAFIAVLCFIILPSLHEVFGANDDFVVSKTAGYAEFLDDLSATSWDEICSATGLARQDIIRVAKLYCASNKTVFAWGMGVTHHLNGVENVEYIANLALLRGMVGKRGAGLLPLRGHSNVQGIGTIGVKPVLAADVFERMERELGISLPTTPGFDTMAGMQAADRHEIDAALIMGGNLYGANPDATFAKRALDRIGFKVFLTTTLNLGHVHGVEKGETIILPVTARDEERQPTTQESMFNFVRLSDGGIDRLDNVRPEVDILCAIGKSLLPDSTLDFDAFAQHSTIRQAIARIVPGMEDLQSIDVAKQEFHIRGRILHEQTFNTDDGKARFCTRSTPATSDELRLTTVRSEGQFNTMIYEEVDTYRQTEDRWCVMLSPEDVAAQGVSVGDRVTLVSDHGRMENVRVYAFDLAPGSAMAYFPEANVLTGATVDPRSKTPSFKATPIRIERP